MTSSRDPTTVTSEESAETVLVTVVICVHNGGADLRPSVESVLAQTHDRLELLVVDDGSTDGCIDTISGIADERLRILTQENQGKSTALNRAIRESSGEFIVIQDADDLSHPLRVERQLACMLDNPDVATVFCGHELILDAEHVAPRSAPLDREACRARIARMVQPGHDPTAMFRRTLTAGFEYEPSLSVGQGLDYILRIGEKHPMLVLGECLYSYRISWSSATRRNAARKQEFVRRIIERACERRGLPASRASEFVLDAKLLGKNRVLDNNLAAHFMESTLDQRREGRWLKAVFTGFRCVRLRPLDPHYYKALVYGILPLGMIQRMRRTVRRTPVAPIPAAGESSTGQP